MWNMVRIGLMASVEMSLENVDDEDDGQQMPAYTISSPMSLQLRWAKNYTGYTSDSWICLFFFGTPGQLTPKWSCKNSDLSEILFLFGLSATFIKINKTKQSMLWTRCNMGFFPQSSNSKVNSPIWLEFNLVRDFMPVRVIILQVS